MAYGKKFIIFHIDIISPENQLLSFWKMWDFATSAFIRVIPSFQNHWRKSNFTESVQMRK
jgi:hypothetical protein